jgi:hypothetical protein
VAHKLSGWRSLFYAKGLIGQDSKRYGGYGYGNLSLRLNAGRRSFVITGTQTSGTAEALIDQHYTVIDNYDIAGNSLETHGPVAPSSEALTHGALYAMDDGYNAVFHAHSPNIWNAAERLGIPTTNPNIEYGTPDMAEEMTRLIKNGAAKLLGIIAMAGHEDGIVTFAHSSGEAGATMLDYRSRANELFRN